MDALDLCICGRTRSQHDQTGRTYHEARGGYLTDRALCPGFQKHEGPIPKCGPGCRNGGRCFEG